MARKRSAGPVSATRSAAAKKGWETRRRGGAAAKPKGGRTAPTQRTSAKTKPTAAPVAKARPAPKGKAKPAATPAAPKKPASTTARGRARTKAAEARKALKAGGGTRAARSLATAQRAADYYKATGTGTKRSKAKGGAPAKATATKTAAKPARSKAGAKPAAQTAAAPARRVNAAAQRAKAMANRTGVVPGSRFESGQAQRTLSLREMRTAVRQHARKAGINTASDFKLMYGLASGVTAKGANGAAVGRMPKTRSDWERIYKNTIGVPQSDRGLRQRPGVIRGIDIHSNFRPGYVFGLKPGASAADVNRAFKQLARTNHPDAGGRAKDFQRLKQMRDSLLATRGGGAASSKPRKSKSKAASTPQPSGPRLLPAAGGTSGKATKPRARRRR